MTNDWLRPDATVIPSTTRRTAPPRCAREAALFLVDQREQFLANRDAGNFDGYPDPMATIGEAILAGTPGRQGRVVVTHLGVGLADLVFADAIVRAGASRRPRPRPRPIGSSALGSTGSGISNENGVPCFVMWPPACRAPMIPPTADRSSRPGRGGGLDGRLLGLRRGIGSAGLLALVLTACGGARDRWRRAVDLPDRCLFAPDPGRIQQALGKPVKAGVETDPSGNSVGCDWDGQVAGDAVAVTLQIDAFDAGLWSIETSAEGVESMPGVGDQAVRGWITNGLLLIKTGDHEVDLGVISVYSDDATIKAAQDRLGKLVVSRL